MSHRYNVDSGNLRSALLSRGYKVVSGNVQCSPVDTRLSQVTCAMLSCGYKVVSGNLCNALLSRGYKVVSGNL